MVTSLASILQRKKDLEAESKRNMFEGVSRGNESARTYADNLVAVQRAKEDQEFNPVNALIGTVAGAGKGFIASGGNPLGAVAGGVAGAVSAPTGRKIKPISSATGGYSRGAGIVDMANDFGGDMEKAGTYLSGFKDNPEEAMTKIGKITQADIDAKNKRDAKVKEAKIERKNKVTDDKTKFERDKELAKIKKNKTDKPNKDDIENYQVDLDAEIDNVLSSINDPEEKANLIKTLESQIRKDFKNKLISYSYYKAKIKELKEM